MEYILADVQWHTKCNNKSIDDKSSQVSEKTDGSSKKYLHIYSVRPIANCTPLNPVQYRLLNNYERGCQFNLGESLGNYRSY